jgi:hypothetical protein
MNRTKEIADLVGALRDLLTIREAPTTGDEARMNRVVKHKARQLIEQYDEDQYLIERAARMDDLFLEVYDDGQVGHKEARQTNGLEGRPSK